MPKTRKKSAPKAPAKRGRPPGAPPGEDTFRYGHLTGAAARRAAEKAAATRARNKKAREAEATKRDETKAHNRREGGRRAWETRRHNADGKIVAGGARSGVPEAPRGSAPKAVGGAGVAGVGPEAERVDEVPPREVRSLTVTLRRDQWERLKGFATDRMRSPEAQAAWILHSVINGLDPKA